MKIQRSLSNTWLWLVMIFLPLFMAQSVRTEVKHNSPTVITTIKRLSEIEHPATKLTKLPSKTLL
ncbi:hypothetical protein [Nostoc sp.]|uniref:hypothetical protein n=1 Tax=Nostoc sp. TaxID=1180 RepID=UPI002FF56080